MQQGCGEGERPCSNKQRIYCEEISQEYQIVLAIKSQHWPRERQADDAEGRKQRAVSCAHQQGLLMMLCALLAGHARNNTRADSETSG